jgi:integrase
VGTNCFSLPIRVIPSLRDLYMKTIWKSTKYPGIRYREHPTRRNGIQKDRYFSIRYQRNRIRKEEGLGWSSEGWTLQKVLLELAELKRGYTTGEGPTRLSEKRDKAKEKKDRKQAEQDQQKKNSLTFGQFFEETYFPQAKANKSERSWLREDQFYRLWVSPFIADKPLKQISLLDLERIKKNLSDQGRAPRTIQYCLATIRQVLNVARTLNLYDGDNPVSRVKKPWVDNRRLRFLSRDEANLLLNALKGKSQNLFEMAIISLHCGLRAGEIFKLIWADVDLERGILTLRDPKGRPGRPAFMTNEVKEIFKNLNRDSNKDFVFPNRKGNKVKEISNAFSRAVKEIGLNKDVNDQRYKVCFHTLRHTFASWLVENGTSLYTVKELLGHSTLAMTERYSHLGENTLQTAVLNLEKSLNKK